ncbi:MAG TPA: hypothetical protein VGS11_11385 [Candidatus Bathyarchaeia archaeon]|nr:hypothetical protein [Candidatus Bathyarchaeia archaeon]
MRTRDHRIILLTLALASLLGSNLEAAHAQPIDSGHALKIFSVNTISNPGFEEIVSGTNQPASWQADYYDSNAGSSVSGNSTLSHSGDYSARIDIAQNQSLARTGNPVTFATTRLYQVFSSNILVSNLTSRPDGLSVWFYIHPKFSGFTLLQVKVKAADTVELDYELGNPALGISFINSTNGGEAGLPVKSIVLPPPSLNQWNNLARNLRQDWLAPLTLSNGTSISGLFRENQTLFRLEFDAFFFEDQLSGTTYGETVWIDDVAVYLDTLAQPGHGFDKGCQSAQSNLFEQPHPSLNHCKDLV